MSDKLVHGNASAFDKVLAIIDNARENALCAVNRELINMYWDIGEYVSQSVVKDGTMLQYE